MVPPLHVALISMQELIVASTDVASAPPNGMTMPAPAVAMVPCAQKIPVPITRELAPAAPMVRNTRSNIRYHGTTEVIGMVCAGDGPSAVPPVPYFGVMINVFVAADCEIVPPART